MQKESNLLDALKAEIDRTRKGLELDREILRERERKSITKRYDTWARSDPTTRTSPTSSKGHRDEEEGRDIHQQDRATTCAQDIGAAAKPTRNIANQVGPNLTGRRKKMQLRRRRTRNHPSKTDRSIQTRASDRAPQHHGIFPLMGSKTN